MAPHEQCAGRGLREGQGSRVQGPPAPPPARAWTETERLRPGDEQRPLLPAPALAAPGKLQAGLTLGVAGIARKNRKCPQIHLGKTKPKVKTKFQKRKDRLIEILRPPYFILSMIVLIVCIHLAGAGGLGAALEWSPRAWRRQPWRLLTYGLLHASPAHLALNALVALVVGWRLEREQRWWRLGALWAGGVAGGALGAGALQPTVHMVGASAGVYALLTAHLPNVCLRFGHIPLWWFRPLSVVVLSASEGLCSLWARDLEGVSWSGGAGDQDRVAWSAHALGALVGVPLGFLVFTGENSGKPALVACRVVSAALLLGGAAAAAYYSLYQPDYRK
ncbi:rhomboid-related protein 2 [Plutella xylostella]|uniref:rhomboid-related protein 2 n=1 Tax=Plutella xylostella TaxID=51655 RepID=UPI002032A5DA|nr:rhomboid-related protein 2 [Plutella xylostella]XP_048479398.1 rhomboid-related protein 2 [Plutella xylostella]